MSTIETSTETAPTGPKRADARRNHDRLLNAAREAFAEGGEPTSLEEIARRAGVGIGTLYRHFPSRQALLEALYVTELDEVCRSAAELAATDPWDALRLWFERLIGYLTTKRALAEELSNYLDPDARLFTECRGALYAAGEPLWERALEAGVVRADVEFPDVLQMVAGITKIPATEPGQVERVLRVALDGLRYRPQP
jgi:AcrR family transcriptional regulator